MGTPGTAAALQSAHEELAKMQQRIKQLETELQVRGAGARCWPQQPADPPCATKDSKEETTQLLQDNGRLAAELQLHSM